MGDSYGAIANNDRFGNTGSRILLVLSVLFTVESICGCSTTYMRVRMEINLAFSDSEVEIIKTLKGFACIPLVCFHVSGTRPKAAATLLLS
jgi:hypothetical protein